jgi:hypothetical protein
VTAGAYGGRAVRCPPAVLAPDALDRLHRAGLELLETVGVQVRGDAALAVLAGAGACRPYARAQHRDVWTSPLFDTSGYEAWAADGSRTLEDRLHEAALDLAARCAPVLDDGADRTRPSGSPARRPATSDRSRSSGAAHDAAVGPPRSHGPAPPTRPHHAVSYCAVEIPIDWVSHILSNMEDEEHT